nr:YoaK family protein [Gluconacetobacter sacchari]
MPSSILPVSISARRVFILGLVAGYVDALSFVDLGGIFAGAMTGNTTHMGASFISGNWHHGLLLAVQGETIAKFSGMPRKLLSQCIRSSPLFQRKSTSCQSSRGSDVATGTGNDPGCLCASSRTGTGGRRTIASMKGGAVRNVNRRVSIACPTRCGPPCVTIVDRARARL